MNPLLAGSFGWRSYHFNSLMETFTVSLLEVGSQINCHVVLHFRLVYNGEGYRLLFGLGKTST